MEFHILLSDDKPKYIQIYEQIRLAILTKKIAAHTRLPAKRRLAEQLNSSVMTVQVAYEQLKSEGYCYSVERTGYFVSEIEDEWHYTKKIPAPSKIAAAEKPFINFKNGQVDPVAFPYKQWNRLYRKELHKYNAGNAPWQGEYSLRVQIAHYLQQARGLDCQPNQVYIFSGVQQQLLNVCLFLKPTAIGVEEPGFIRAKSVFRQLQLPCHTVPLDEEGCTVPNTTIKLLYTTPAHQYPTGIIMSVARRTQLLQWARHQNAYILEDDYDSEFRYKGVPIPTLSQLDSSDRVLYFGTFSKTLLPSLRISYLVVPTSLQADFEKFNTYQKSTVSKIDQQVVAAFMDNEYYAAHIAKMRTLYRAKRNYLIENITKQLGKEFSIAGDAAGLHMIVHLPARLNESMAIELAKSKGVEIDAVSTMYQINKPCHQVMIGYGAPSLNEIQEGVALLAEVWK